MSKEVEVQSSNDIIKDVGGTTQQMDEDLAKLKSESSKAEETPSPKETSASDINELKGLTQQLVELAKTQNETIAAQREELSKLKEDLNALNNDYQSHKPLDVRAEVVGMFDWGRQIHHFKNEQYQSQKDYAYNLFKSIELEFPGA